MSDEDMPTPPETRGTRHALESDCSRRHENQSRARSADREFLLEKIGTIAGEVHELRGWRNEEANQKQTAARAPWGQILAFAFSLVALGGGVVAAWLSSDQRLTRIEVRVESLTESMDGLVAAQRDWLRDAAQRATEAASLTTRLDAIDARLYERGSRLDAIDARLRSLERRRPGAGPDRDP